MGRALEIGQVFQEHTSVTDAEGVEPKCNANFWARRRPARGLMEIGVVDSEELLPARPKDKPDRINNRSLTGIILADQDRYTGGKRHAERIVSFAEDAKVLDLDFRQSHASTPCCVHGGGCAYYGIQQTR